MPRSMTAYHKSSLSKEEGEWTIEIQSVNRKGLDISLWIPKEFFSLENEVRKWLSHSITRGQVTFRAHFQPKMDRAMKHDFVLNELSYLMEIWKERATKLGMDPSKEINLTFLFNQWQLAPIMPRPIDQEVILHLKQAVDDALSGFLAMRQKEGNFLREEILAILKKIKERASEIKDKSALSYEKGKMKLEQKVREALQGFESLEDRVLKECALLADRLDISEEIARIDSHIFQFEEFMSDDAPVGRTLEFLLQELSREINTIGSKCADLQISQIVIDMKTNVEKIREQVQNIE